MTPHEQTIELCNFLKRNTTILAHVLGYFGIDFQRTKDTYKVPCPCCHGPARLFIANTPKPFALYWFCVSGAKCHRDVSPSVVGLIQHHCHHADTAYTLERIHLALRHLSSGHLSGSRDLKCIIFVLEPEPKPPFDIPDTIAF
jgi:hypothetical protein